MRGNELRLSTFNFLAWLCTLLVIFLPGSPAGFAQQSTEESCPDGQVGSPCLARGTTPLTTLHVYLNLEQFPVLVLSPSRTAMKADKSEFRVSLDSGREFKPDHVRIEGDDPVSFAILIDTTKPSSTFLPRLSASLAQLADGSFRPSDNLSVYVMSCSLIRTAYNSTPDPFSLKKAMQDALALSRAEQAEGCNHGMPLWDSMALVVGELQKLSQYRVLIAITDGYDSGSKSSWNQVRLLTQITSVAVFGISPALDKLSHGPTSPPMRRIPISESRFHAEDPFDSICQLSGGIQTFTEGRKLGNALVQVVQMVRNRYIVSFSLWFATGISFHFP